MNIYQLINFVCTGLNFVLFTIAFLKFRKMKKVNKEFDTTCVE